MKTILTETFSIIKVSLFWALALPAAAIIFPVVAGWQKLNSLISRVQSSRQDPSVRSSGPPHAKKSCAATGWMIAELGGEEFFLRVAIRPVIRRG